MKEYFCSACGSEIGSGEVSVRCRLCLHNYHASCWEKCGGCVTPGCPGRLKHDPDLKTYALKKCPCCGEGIVDFAVICPYCRTGLGANSETTEMPVRQERVLRENSYRKDPVLAGLLNLIFPGAGYMYLGYFNQGLFWFFAAVASWFFTRGYGLIALYPWVIFDSVRQALLLNRNEKTAAQKRQNP